MVYRVEGKEEVVDLHGDGEDDLFASHYYLVKCIGCSCLSLLEDWDLSDNPGCFAEASILYPAVQGLDAVVPKVLSKIFKEAKSIKVNAPTAFAILMRKCIEIICADKEAEGRFLKEKIQNLADKGIIPTSMIDIATAIKILGDISAHSTDVTPDSDQNTIIEDFLVLIVEHVYVVPGKLAQVQALIASQKKASRPGVTSV